MQSEIDIIQKRMDELTVLIKETKDRLPAHSVKPPIMMELLDYEDEYNDLRTSLAALKKQKA